VHVADRARGVALALEHVDELGDVARPQVDELPLPEREPVRARELRRDVIAVALRVVLRGTRLPAREPSGRVRVERRRVAGFDLGPEVRALGDLALALALERGRAAAVELRRLTDRATLPPEAGVIDDLFTDLP
jgi:hypothetical protein